MDTPTPNLAAPLRRDDILRGGVDRLDAFVGEGQDPVLIVGAVDPDDAVLGFETEGKVMDERFADAEVPGDTFDGGDAKGGTRRRLR
ncbi:MULTISPECIES: hypothetical protein [unclassified Mesorhizobium]|uniref:hypothetical protein n=1 Tax=unclassified Mesorhizobium TaxID=325217 RepID=UPI001927CA29|nr:MULTISPECIES: hypothetical protein [unclassified Mesorhizobium]BCG97324.1 hypothetical protein MesoLj131a_61880 [Mesorhizobium sp. 131-2-1]BCH04395.1 hypothetical protein MesoLj131b_63940 [Mesorhizobium sp. 131-2-5]